MTITAADYLKAMRVRARLQQEMAEALKDVDVYVTVPLGGPSILYTNLAGQPTVVTRCGMIAGRPASIEFTGNLYREAAALRVALAFERATPWHTQWPDVEKTTAGA
jgi:aspartyl-tRNA(Asn)/glutamyl-tRNA(Gln) amidotransferase subunit A